MVLKWTFFHVEPWCLVCARCWEFSCSRCNLILADWLEARLPLKCLGCTSTLRQGVLLKKQTGQCCYTRLLRWVSTYSACSSLFSQTIFLWGMFVPQSPTMFTSRQIFASYSVSIAVICYRYFIHVNGAISVLSSPKRVCSIELCCRSLVVPETRSSLWSNGFSPQYVQINEKWSLIW